MGNGVLQAEREPDVDVAVAAEVPEAVSGVEGDDVGGAPETASGAEAAGAGEAKSNDVAEFADGINYTNFYNQARDIQALAEGDKATKLRSETTNELLKATWKARAIMSVNFDDYLDLKPEAKEELHKIANEVARPTKYDDGIIAYRFTEGEVLAVTEMFKKVNHKWDNRELFKGIWDMMKGVEEDKDRAIRGNNMRHSDTRLTVGQDVLRWWQVRVSLLVVSWIDHNTSMEKGPGESKASDASEEPKSDRKPFKDLETAVNGMFTFDNNDLNTVLKEAIGSRSMQGKIIIQALAEELQEEAPEGTFEAGTEESKLFEVYSSIIEDDGEEGKPLAGGADVHARLRQAVATVGDNVAMGRHPAWRPKPLAGGQSARLYSPDELRRIFAHSKRPVAKPSPMRGGHTDESVMERVKDMAAAVTAGLQNIADPEVRRKARDAIVAAAGPAPTPEAALVGGAMMLRGGINPINMLSSVLTKVLPTRATAALNESAKKIMKYLDLCVECLKTDKVLDFIDKLYRGTKSRFKTFASTVYQGINSALSTPLGKMAAVVFSSITAIFATSVSATAVLGVMATGALAVGLFRLYAHDAKDATDYKLAAYEPGRKYSFPTLMTAEDPKKRDLLTDAIMDVAQLRNINAGQVWSAYMAFAHGLPPHPNFKGNMVEVRDLYDEVVKSAKRS